MMELKETLVGVLKVTGPVFNTLISYRPKPQPATLKS